DHRLRRVDEQDVHLRRSPDHRQGRHLRGHRRRLPVHPVRRPLRQAPPDHPRRLPRHLRQRRLPALRHHRRRPETPHHPRPRAAGLAVAEAVMNIHNPSGLVFGYINIMQKLGRPLVTLKSHYAMLSYIALTRNAYASAHDFFKKYFISHTVYEWASRYTAV